MGLMAMAAIAGVGNAFAFNLPKKVTGATYYSYRVDSSHIGWTSTRPPGTSCQAASNLACTITSTADPSVVEATTNAFPPDTGSKSHLNDINE
jgi:hypothetical protein